MKPASVRRMVDSIFDPNVFHNFYNVILDNSTLSSGITSNPDDTITFTPEGSLSSSNWQIYYQQGRYFIRNYDYGDRQLGITEDERSLPRMRPRSGALGQQWSFMKVEGSEGQWRISNGLLGNDTWFGLNMGNRDNKVPGMQVSSSGAVWDVRPNQDAGRVKGSLLLTDVEDFEVAPSPSPTPTPSSTVSSAASPNSAPTSLNPLSQESSSALPPSSTSTSSLSTGAIVGIAIGGAAVILVSAFVAWFIIARRRRGTNGPAELPGSASGEKQGRWAYMGRGAGGAGTKGRVETPPVELGNDDMVFEAPHKGTERPRYELG